MSIPISTPGSRRVWGLIVASALCWMWGTLVALFYLPTFLEYVRAGMPQADLVAKGLAAFCIAALYWLAAYATGRRQVVGGTAAIGISGFFTILVMTPPDLGGLIAAAINLAIIALVIFNWRHLRRRGADGVGANTSA